MDVEILNALDPATVRSRVRPQGSIEVIARLVTPVEERWIAARAIRWSSDAVQVVWVIRAPDGSGTDGLAWLAASDVARSLVAPTSSTWTQANADRRRGNRG